MRSPRVRLVAVCLLLALGCPVVASAQTLPAEIRAQAMSKKAEGDDAMVGLRYSDALAAYQVSYALTHDPALLYNMGRAHQGLDHLPEALDMLERFRAEASTALRARVPKLDELIASVKKQVATISLTSNVAGARVVVRDRVIGQTPLAGPLRLKAGPAMVEVSAEGYTTFRRQLDLAAGGDTILDATLLSKDRSGVLVVRSEVDGAVVSVDGGAPSNAPFEIIVEAGTHRIRVTKVGRVAVDTSAVVVAGERKEVTLTPAAEKPLTSQWWFWTGLGVVVAGGAATVAALLTERKASSGTIPPGQVAAALVRF